MTEATQIDPASPEAPRRRTVTILFSDLSESTRIAGSLEAEEYSDLLERLRAIYHRVISEHRGVIAQISGDGMLAAFGHPEPCEDDATRAVDAALDLRDAVRALGGEARWRDVAPRLHSGVHSGRVLLTVGDAVRGRFELLGRPTNIASRLCGSAGPDEILVSETTLGPERYLFETRAVGKLPLRGKDEPVPTLMILGRAPIRSRYAASERAGLTPFVGREAELSHLGRSLDGVIAGNGLLLEIRGAPGEGKTRLAQEFLRDAAERGCPVHRSECDARAEPLQPFLQIARSIFGIGPSLQGDEAARRVEEGLARIDGALPAHRPVWLRLLSLDRKAAAGDRETAVKREDAATAIHALLETLARRQPLILFIDDWHLADDASRATLAALSGIGSLFILMTGRPDEAGDVEIGDREVLRLPRFTEAETAQVVGRLLPAPDPFLVGGIRDSSGGKPLFIEELCHAIASGETDVELVEGTSWIGTLIQSRLSRLPPAQADLVRAASIVGDVIPVWLFEMICSCDVADPLVTQLAEADFIFPGEREGTLKFKHGLTREVVYNGIGLRERVTMHLYIAGALRNWIAERGEEEPIEALAYHFAHGESWAEAADYAELAGDKALESAAIDRAQAQYRVALDALDRLPPSAETALRWNRVAERFGRAGVFDPAREQLAILERAIERARLAGDAAALARAHFWLGYIHYGLGEPMGAIPHCERALEAARAADDDPLAVQILAALGQAKAAACDYAGALVLLDEAIAVKRRHRSGRHAPIGLAYSLSCKAFALGDMGRFEEAHVCFEEAMAAIGGLGHAGEVSILNQQAVVHLWQDRVGEARSLAAAGMQVAERVGSYYSHAMSRSIRAYAHWLLEPDPGAVRTVVEATAWLEAKERGQFTSLNYGWLAEMMVAEGRLAEGRRYAALALRRARKHDRLGEAMALRAMARAAAQEGRPRRPALYLDRAMRSARIRNSPHELALTHLCRGELSLAAGDRPAAAAEFRLARKALAAIGMDFRPAQADLAARAATP